MELLDMVPADAIALRLCALPAAAGSLWAWLVAALAAAVGLWRIRAASASNSSRPGAGAVRSVSALVDDGKLHQEQKAPSLPSPAAATDDEPRPAAASASEPGTPSKVRFTAYYGGSGDDGVVDGVRKCAGADDDEEEAEEDVARGRGVEMVLRRTASDPGRRRTTSPSWEEREMAVRRSSDLGWYRHIDMAALDGSVVRLWDGELTASASPRGRRRRAGLELFQLSL
ncbi:hypothetical protein U9M48_014497 [Paspalum notatum var. saurae]|uniref:Uncharacterized protein n=1 Tax=Paspalum notatum var. saurae TaxID=547442 RepID=A0AAQ3WKU6_PASNO